MPDARPTVLCHMIASLDGRLHPSRYTVSPDGTPKDWGALYEVIHDRLDADAWIVGRVTAAEMAKGEPHPPANPGAPERPVHIGQAVRDNPDGTRAVVLDASGKVHFAKPDIGGDTVIVLLGADASDAHLAELAGDGVSYIVADGSEIDLGRALATLKTAFNIDRLLLEGGGGINGSFFANGLVDEFSVVMTPALDGDRDADSVVSLAGGLKGKAQLTFAGAEPLAHGAVHLRYTVQPG